MNINLQNTLNKLLYNSISQNIDIENNNKTNISIETLNENLISNSIQELELLLNNFNLPLNKENTDLIKILAQNNLPLTKENLQNIIKSTKMFKSYPIEKALFLIENKLNPTLEIDKQIDNYISKNTIIDKQIENLFESLNFNKSIFKNTNFEKEFNKNFQLFTNLKDEILKTINKLTFNNINENEKNNLLKNIIDYTINESILINEKPLKILDNIINLPNKNINELQLNNYNIKKNLQIDSNILKIVQKEIFNIIKNDTKLNIKFKDIVHNFSNFQKSLKSFNFEKSSTEDLNKYFNDITTITKNIKTYINNDINNNENETILNNLNNLNKNIDFMNNLKNSTFIQIPLSINNFSTTAELFILPNKKNKSSSSKNKNGSALISLNLLYIGKIEVLINKINLNISCQFRLENENTKLLVKQNLPLLNQYLKDKNLNLKDVTFKDLFENFSIVDLNKKNTIPKDFKISNFNVKA